MKKMTVAEAAEHFNVSKEAIHNRVRRGSLSSIVENGTKYVMVDAPAPASQKEQPHTDKRYYDYIEAENERLRKKVEKLENETLSLREKREQMLIAERDKIEQIYKERDEQLKTVLHVVASKFLTAQNISQVVDEAINEESEDAEVIEQTPLEKPKKSTKISLKKFMKIKGYGKKKRDKIKSRFTMLAKTEKRIFKKEGKIYIDPGRFDYSDLL